ncbi:MAG: response regulator [Desulfobacula sp.]|nr:response regulator [Desulfobacula sp.]
MNFPSTKIFKNSKILIVDDEPRLCDGIKMLLSKQGYDVRTCNSGIEALNFFIEDEFDLVLLDVFMEGMDGFQVIENIIKQKIDTSVIIITGSASTQTAVKALRMGANDYLKKPFEPEELYTSVKNILNRRALAKKLKVSEEKFRNLMENIDTVAVQGYGPDGTTQYWNKASERLYGYNQQEAIGRNLIDLIIPSEMKDDVATAIREMAVSGRPIPSGELSLRHKNGSRVPVISHHAIVKVPGCEQELFCLDVDITERKRIERELFFKESIIKSSSCAIAACDLEGNMTYGNPFFQKLWGFDGPGDFLGKPFRRFWLLGDQDEDIVRALQSEGTWAGELKGMKKDGSLFDVQVSAATVLDDSGNPNALTSTSIDITERKAIEAQFQQFQKTESLARMAGAIAHHFNNQLSVVMGNLELSLMDLPTEAKIRENLLRSMMAAQKATEVSRQMLIYLGQTPGRHEPMDLSRACRQSLSLVQTVIPKGIIININFPDSGPVIRADEGQINQALGNLITNAWEAISNNQGTIGIAIRTVSRTDIPTSKRFPMGWQPRHIPYACLEVSDRGCGVTGIDIEKLFDPFFTTKFTGRGMGLAVVMGIVKSHDGCITVDSESGSGSTFRIYLPISMEKIPRQQAKEAVTPAWKSEISGAVLLIEDEEMIRDMAKNMLIRFGYTVIEAQDGVEAVEIFQKRQNEICCVLSDLSMPRMGGWETLSALRKIRTDLPVILASGHNKDVVMAGNHPELPQAFLYKPYSMSALKEALSKAMSL